MTTPVLVATPHPTFGELLCLSLEENGEYQVKQVETARQALDCSGNLDFVLAILDSDLADQPFPELVRTLHSLQPGLRLIVIPPENNQAHPSLVGIQMDACLNRPFYLPDMLQTVKKVLSTGDPMPEEKSADPSPVFPWQTDPAQARRRLASVLAGSPAHAALIMRGRQMWASSGPLEQAAVEEIAATLGRYLDGDEKSDLARFVRLNSSKNEYMVYATPLLEDLMLALVFDASTPLTRIRSQVIKLGRSLKQSEAATSLPPGSPSPVSPPSSQPSSVPLSPLPSDSASESEQFTDDFQEENTQISLAELLANMPAPDPAAEGPDAQEWMLTPNQNELAAEDLDDPAPLPPQPRASDPSKIVMPPKNSHLAPAPAGDDSLADTQPLLLQPLNHLNDLEPTSQAYSRLTYTCLMIPRMPHHYLAGELADRLGQWFQQCCLAFGWRLEGISIRPEYLQWTVQVAPAISPGNLVRIVRQRISLHIFGNYPHLAEQNPSGDFWANGYLIVSGIQPPSAQLLRDYIAQTRKRQGIK